MFKALRENWQGILEVAVITLMSMLIIIGFAGMVTPY